MPTMKSLAEDFLAQKRIAVAGVSRSNDSSPANLIYRKLRQGSHEVFAVNPNSSEFKGDRCYPDLKSIPGGVDGVVIVTRPETAEEIVQQCQEAGVSRVWMHRSFGQGSVSETATEFCRQHGMTVIPGGCPMMYCDPPDWGHRCMRWALGVFGALPKAD